MELPRGSQSNWELIQEQSFFFVARFQTLKYLKNLEASITTRTTSANCGSQGRKISTRGCQYDIEQIKKKQNSKIKQPLWPHSGENCRTNSIWRSWRVATTLNDCKMLSPSSFFGNHTVALWWLCSREDWRSLEIPSVPNILQKNKTTTTNNSSTMLNSLFKGQQHMSSDQVRSSCDTYAKEELWLSDWFLPQVLLLLVVVLSVSTKSSLRTFAICKSLFPSNVSPFIFLSGVLLILVFFSLILLCLETKSCSCHNAYREKRSAVDRRQYSRVPRLIPCRSKSTANQLWKEEDAHRKIV